jgi:putative SOS response-associated peptidase YedK
MCNEFVQERAWAAYCEMMLQQFLPIVSDQPDYLPAGSVPPSERVAILQAAPGGSRLALYPWGWPPYAGRGLVINVQSESRRDAPSARGIAPMNRFYEFRGTKPPRANSSSVLRECRSSPSGSGMRSPIDGDSFSRDDVAFWGGLAIGSFNNE